MNTLHTFLKLNTFDPQENPHCSDILVQESYDPTTLIRKSLENGSLAKLAVLPSPQGELWMRQRGDMTNIQWRWKEKEGSPLYFGIRALALKQRKRDHQSFEADAHIKGSTHLLLVMS